jgi:hypothetical protein
MINGEGAPVVPSTCLVVCDNEADFFIFSFIFDMSTQEGDEDSNL